MPENEDLILGLKQAKTQPRHVGLVAKGADTVHLIVQKKPIKDGDLTKAKSEFKGNAVYRGVVQFDGDGYVFSFLEEPAIGLVKLRKFLIESTGLNFKATIQVLPVLPTVPDDELLASMVQSSTPTPEPVATPEPPGEPVSSKPVEPPAGPESSEPEDDRLQKFAATLKSLTPRVQQALAAAPERKAELFQAVSAAKSAIDEKRADDCPAALKTLAGLLQEIMAAEGDVAVPDGETVDVDERLMENLFGDLFADLTADEPGTESPADVQGEVPASPSPLEMTVEQLSALPNPPLPPSSKAPSIGGRMQWEAAKQTVSENLAKLQSHLRSSEDPGLKRIGEIGFHAITGKLQVGLRVALMEYDQAAKSEDREKFRVKALAIIADYQKFVANDRLVALCDENKFGVKVDARTTLGAALTALAKSLEA